MTELVLSLAITPTPRGELSDFIGSLDGRIGEVHQRTLSGMNPAEVARDLGVDSPTFVYARQRDINAALDGIVPTGPSTLRATATSLRSLLRKGRDVLSPEAFALLDAHYRSVDTAARATDPEDADAESDNAEVVESDEIARLLTGVPGIYAFSYRTYLDHPVSNDREDVLLKVGCSDNIARRIAEHRAGARAHIPEPLVTVRAFAVPNPGAEILVERHFHALLRTAGHENPRRVVTGRKNEVGREWFRTNVDFLDAVAGVLNLRTVYSS